MAVTNKIVPYYKAGGPVRGTQTFVHTLSSCWSRPSLTGLEVLWRWVFGVPTLLVLWTLGRRLLTADTAGTADFSRLGLDRAFLSDPVGSLTADPMGTVAKVEAAAGVVLPDVLRIAVWLAPLLVVVWIVVSSIGRTVVLRRADSALQPRVFTLMMLQVIRLGALAFSFRVWFGLIRTAASVAVITPMDSGQEPNLVLYCAISIVSTLGLFVLWGAVSWYFSIAPLLAMIQGLGVAGSLKAALRLGSLKSKLVEINLVMGIVKIGLIVLGMVFSATPLPFQTVTTPGFLACWWVGVTVLYLVGSDFFHVARLVAYLNLWRGHEEEISLRAK
jgi:hypothetical protein